MQSRGLFAAGLSLALAAVPAAACEIPDEGSSAPMRRLIARVKYLHETEVWAELMSRTRTVVQYVLHLDQPRRMEGRCYWPVEIRAEDRVWKRFLVPGGAEPVIELPSAK